ACAEALAGTAVDLAWYTTRERDYGEVLPWDHLDSGLDRDWLWEDWQSAVSPAGADEVEDCRWTPCYECGVCPAMGTEIQTGPTGERLDGRRLLPVLATNRREDWASYRSAASRSRPSIFWSGMLNGERCVLPATWMWREPSSGACGGRACRSRTRLGSRRPPRFPTQAAPRPGSRARQST